MSGTTKFAPWIAVSATNAASADLAARRPQCLRVRSALCDGAGMTDMPLAWDQKPNDQLIFAGGKRPAYWVLSQAGDLAVDHVP
jgi:hypothetical protein